MVILYVLLALFIICVLAGALLLDYTCGRKPMDDMWDADMVRKHGFGMLWDSIYAGSQWLKKQHTEPLEAVSYDGKLLKALFVPCENARATVLLFHGWRSSWKLDFSSVFQYYNGLGLNLLLVDQRGQGESEGRFITFGVRERQDVLTWATYMGQLLGEEQPLFLDGVSMGAATVLMAADMDFPANVRGILADCGFVSPYEIFDSVMSKKGRFFPRRAALLLLGAFTRVFAGFGLKEHSTVQALAKTKYPVLFVHGTADDFVPWEMSRRGYDACAGEKELILVEGAGHAMSFFTQPQRVKAALEAFIDRNLA